MDIAGRAEEKKTSRASIAQGLEHWSCKPGVESSNLSGGKTYFFIFFPEKKKEMTRALHCFRQQTKYHFLFYY